MLEPWQQYIYDNSRHQVEEYEELQEAYDNYKMHKRQKQTSKQPLGPAPSKPKVVKQRNLALTGNVTQARLVMETVLSMFSQDFGKYNDVLNKSYHHEPVGSSTKSSGSFMVKRPNLALLLSGTPAMLPRLIPSTENGLFSRILMYRIPGSGTYRPLTSADDSPAASEYFVNASIVFSSASTTMSVLSVTKTWNRRSCAIVWLFFA